MQKKSNRNPWAWIPSLYFAEGLPYVIVMSVSVIMYKRLGISNTEIALYTSWLYLPWVIKPLWSPIVDIFKTKRLWIIVMQLFIGAGLAGVAITIPGPKFFQYTLAFFWLLAFSSATHDIAADGFYMLGLSKKDQAFFVGIRSTFYRFAMIAGQGLLVILAGYFESSTGLPPVDINIQANPNRVVSEYINLDEIQILPLEGELRVIPSESNLKISTTPTTNVNVNFWLNFTHNLNKLNNFYDSKIELATNHDTNYVGNIGILYFGLSKMPEEEIFVEVINSSDSENFKILEGKKFSFTKENWNKPAFTVIQLDSSVTNNLNASFKISSGNIPLAWSITFYILAGMFLLFVVYHKFILPRPAADVSSVSRFKGRSKLSEFGSTFVLFFKKEKIGLILGFLLVYRLGEAQLVKLASPFMLDPRSIGGLGLSTTEVGFVYGTVGIIALTLGGILGGFVASKKGLKYWIWWMVIAINIPNVVYVYLSTLIPDSFLIINICVGLEQFGYGFGFTAYILYMIYISDGDHKTSHYAIATGFMALGMMLPGMVSGWIQETVGYQMFFVWVIISTIPAFLITKFIPLDPEFGKKEE